MQNDADPQGQPSPNDGQQTVGALLDAAIRRLTAPPDLQEVVATLLELQRSAPVSQRPLTVREFCAETGLCRDTVYDAVKRGELTHVRVGRKVLIPRSVLTAIQLGGGTVLKSRSSRT